MKLSNFLNLFLLLCLTKFSTSLKGVEKCIHKALNYKDQEFRFMSDFEDIHRAIL